MTKRAADQRKREEERLVKLFMNHVPESKRNKEMLATQFERIKNHKMISFEHSDEYSREWFKTIYHLNRNLKL